MRKVINGFLVLVLSLCMLSSNAALIASAASLSKVTTLTASAKTNTTITLKWSSVKKAKGYVLYRYNTSNKKWVSIKTMSERTFKDTSLKAGTVYSYRVRAYTTEKSKRVYGAYSDTYKVATLPSKVTNLKATSVGDTTLTLSWSKASGAEYYQVAYYNASEKKYKSLVKQAGTSCTVKNLVPNKSYSFKVRAYHKKNGTVYGSYSSVLTVKTKPADTVGFKLGAVTKDTVTLSWSASKGVSGYQLVIYNDSTKKWESVTRTTGKSCTITNLESGTAYKFKLRTYIKSGKTYTYGVYSKVITAVTGLSVPTGLEAAVNSDKGISLKWNAVKGADGYEIHTYDPQHGSWSLLASTRKASYNHNSLSQSREYKYKVRAYVVANGVKQYSSFCESVAVTFISNESSNNIYTDQMAASGIFGYLYDPEENCFYTASDPWQRKIGYNSIFDVTAPMTLIAFDTARLRFEYQNKDWMIQLWKGQYGLIFYGAEVGVYTKPKDRNMMHYDAASDNEMLRMSMTFLEKKTVLGKTTWKEQFTRPYGQYWWCTGFIPGNILGRFENLRIKMRITMKDYEMLSGVKAALEANKIEYAVSGLDVYFTYI